MRARARRVLLDTHIWLWWLLPDSPMSDRDRSRIDELARDGGTHLAAISLWEAQMLHAKRRIELPIPFATWLRRATRSDVVKVLPLDSEAVIAVDGLPTDFHGDPADRMIVATARVHELVLATLDESIRESRLVKVWAR